MAASRPLQKGTAGGRPLCVCAEYLKKSILIAWLPGTFSMLTMVISYMQNSYGPPGRPMSHETMSNCVTLQLYEHPSIAAVLATHLADNHIKPDAA
jgi:hypothetical protein